MRGEGPSAASSSAGRGASLPDQLFRIFSSTLSPDKDTRKSAEDALSELAERDPNFILHLLEFASQSPTVCAKSFQSSTSGIGSILLASAIRFRNEVGRSDWNRNPRCTEEVKTNVRDHIVSLQCQPYVSEAVRRQLLAATIEVINFDYPQLWPGLLPELTGLLRQSMTALQALFDSHRSASPDIDGPVMAMMLQQLKGAFGVLRGCCKIYEDPLRVNAEDADAFAGELAPILVALMEVLSQRWSQELAALADHGASATTSAALLTTPFKFSAELDEMAHCMRLNLKCIFSLFASRCPLCFCEANVMDYFYTTCVVKPVETFLQVVLPLCRARLEHALHHPADAGMTATQLHGDHFADFQKSAMFMLLKWVVNVAYKSTQEFASPKACERRCRDVAKHFVSCYLRPTVETALALVRWHAGPPLALTSKAYILALEVLTLAADHKAMYLNVLHPNAEEIMTLLLFPRLAFTAEDEELWCDNPAEFIRKQSNPASDIYSAKVVSTSLLVTLAAGRKKFHAKELLPALVNFLLNQLQAYVDAAAQATSVEADLYTPAMEAARRVDAALYCFYHFKTVLLGMQFGDDKLESVLLTYTVPVAQYPLGFLRVRAALVLSTFAPTLQWSSPQAYQRALQPVLGLLNDSEAPVRIQACECFSRLVCHPYARDLINPCIAELVQHYFNVMRMMDNEAVVRTLRKTISFYKDTLSQWALELTEMLVNHFATVLDRVTTRYNALESMTAPSTALASSGEDTKEQLLDDDDYADVLMTADELLETLKTLVKALPESTRTVAVRHAAAASSSVDARLPPTSPQLLPLSADELHRDQFMLIQLRVAPMMYVILSHQGGSSYGFMDPVLSLLTVLIARSPAIAPSMWKVMWCLYQLVIRGGAADYIQQLLPPIDNFVSVEPVSFRRHTLAELAREPLPAAVPVEEASKTPAQLVFAMCETVLESTSLREREVAAVPKIFDALVQSCWATSAVPTEAEGALIQCVAEKALTIAGMRPRQSATFRVLLANNIFSCLVASVPATVAVLHCVQAARLFWEQYVALLAQIVCIDGTDENVLGLTRSYDRSLFLYAVVACLRALSSNIVGDGASELQAGLESVVRSGVLQQVAEMENISNEAELQIHRRRIAKLSVADGIASSARDGANIHDEDNGEDEEEWDSEEVDDDDDDDDVFGDGDYEEDEDGEWDDDGDDGEGEAEILCHAGAGPSVSGDRRFKNILHQARALRQQQQSKTGMDDPAGLDDLDGDNVLDDEDFSSPLDHVNVWALFVSEVEREDALLRGAGSAAVISMLRSADCQAQAAAIVRARDVMCELQAARTTHCVLQEQSRHRTAS